MVDLSAEVRNHGTNIIGLVICPVIETGSKPPGAVSRDKHDRTSGFVPLQMLESGAMRVSGFKATWILIRCGNKLQKL